MKINSFINFETPGILNLGNIVVVSDNNPKNKPFMFLVAGIKDKNNEYQKYILIDLNTGDVVYEGPEYEDSAELWDYFIEAQENGLNNVFVIGNNNIEISFKNN